MTYSIDAPFPLFPLALVGLVSSLPQAIRAFRGTGGRGAWRWVVVAYGSGFGLYAMPVVGIIKITNPNGLEQFEERLQWHAGVEGVTVPIFATFISILLIGVGVWWGFTACCRAVGMLDTPDTAATTPPEPGGRPFTSAAS